MKEQPIRNTIFLQVWFLSEVACETIDFLQTLYEFSCFFFECFEHMLLFLRYSCGSPAVSLKALMRLSQHEGVMIQFTSNSCLLHLFVHFACLSYIVFPSYKGFIFSPDSILFNCHFCLFLIQFHCFAACLCQSTVLYVHCQVNPLLVSLDGLMPQQLM